MISMIMFALELFLIDMQLLKNCYLNLKAENHDDEYEE